MLYIKTALISHLKGLSLHQSGARHFCHQYWQGHRQKSTEPLTAKSLKAYGACQLFWLTVFSYVQGNVNVNAEPAHRAIIEGL